jgi:hypothetical protein
MGVNVSFSPERELYIFRVWLLYNGIVVYCFPHPSPPQKGGSREVNVLLIIDSFAPIIPD